MQRLFFSLITLALVACGGPDNDGASQGGRPGPSPSPLASGFAGAWTGTTTVAFDGMESVSYQAQLLASVTGNTLQVAAICPDGSNQIFVSGSGSSVNWNGSLTCPAVPFAGCAAVALTYTTGTLALSNGTLGVTVHGSGSGCNTTRSATITFGGTK